MALENSQQEYNSKTQALLDLIGSVVAKGELTEQDKKDIESSKSSYKSSYIDVTKDMKTTEQSYNDKQLDYVKNQIIEINKTVFDITGDVHINKFEVEELYADNANIKNLVAEKATIEDLKVTNAEIETLKTKDLVAINASIENLKTTKLETKDLTAINADIENLKSKKASIEELEAVSAEINTLKTVDLTAINATIENLKATKLEVKDLTVIKADIENLKTDKLEAKDLTAINADISNLKANKATIEQLNATNAEINNLKTKDLVAINASIKNLTANKAEISDLNATNADISSLQATVGKIQTLVGGNLTMDNIQSLILTSTKVTVQDAFIKNAMIDTISASKLNTGELNTNLVRITSSDGSLILNGSLQQFKDKNNKVRIQMGRDAQGNFTFAIFDETGTGTLIDSTGVKANAIGNGLIVDSMINDNANIDGGKLDIDSVVTEVNNGTTLIKGTKIKLDKENQTLEVAFNSMKTSTTETDKTVSNHTTSINAMNGQITTLISDSTIVEDGQSKKLKDVYSSLKITVNGLSSTVSAVKSDLAENYSTTTAMNSAIDQKATGILSTVSSTYTTKKDFDNLEIGGTNLFAKSNDFSTVNGFQGAILTKTYNVVVPEWGGKTGTRIVSTGGTNTIKMVKGNTPGCYWPSTDTYTMSMWVKNNSTTTSVDIRSNGLVNVTTNDVTVKPGESKRITVIGKGNTAGSMQFNFQVPSVNDNFDITVGYAQIEKGNKPGDWSPAPEDIANSISSVEQTANKVEWLIKSGTGSSNMVLTDQLYSILTNNIKLTAKNITLEGLITANQNFKILTDGTIEAKNANISGVLNGATIIGSTIDGTTFTSKATLDASEEYYNVITIGDGKFVSQDTQRGTTHFRSELSKGRLTLYSWPGASNQSDSYLDATGFRFRDSAGAEIIRSYMNKLIVGYPSQFDGAVSAKVVNITGVLTTTSNLNANGVNTFNGATTFTNSLTANGNTVLRNTTINGTTSLKSTLSVEGVSTFIGELVCNNYLSINAWPGYGSGKAQMWFDGNSKALIAQGIDVLRVGNNEVVHKGMYPKPGNWFNGGPVTIGTDGVMEIGRYIDFHNTSGTAADYTARLDCTAQNKLQLGGTFVANDYQKGGYALGLAGEQSINSVGEISYMYLGDILIAYGKVEFTGLVANTAKTIELNFGKTFTKPPLVNVSVNSASPHQCSTGCGGVTATGCNIYLTRTNTIDTAVFWIAIGKRAN